MEITWGPMSPRPKSLARGSYAAEGDLFVPGPGFARFLAMNHVTHVLAPAPVASQRLEAIPSGTDWTRLYRVRDPLPLAYFVARGVAVTDDRAAARMLFAEAFSPRAEVLLHDAPPGVPSVPRGGPATLVAATSTRPSGAALTARVDAPTDGWLVLAESWYPGWTVAVDGRPAALVRANINQKAVALAAGAHRVDFAFRPRSLARGAVVSAASLACLLAAALWIARRRLSDRA
jgi:hypothetical protein